MRTASVYLLMFFMFICYCRLGTESFSLSPLEFPDKMLAFCSFEINSSAPFVFLTAPRWGECVKRSKESHIPSCQCVCAVCHFMVRIKTISQNSSLIHKIQSSATDVILEHVLKTEEQTVSGSTYSNFRELLSSSRISRSAFFFHSANNFAMKAKRKTLNAGDVLAAMEEMEFERFLEPLREALEGQYSSETPGCRETCQKIDIPSLTFLQLMVVVCVPPQQFIRRARRERRRCLSRSAKIKKRRPTLRTTRAGRRKRRRRRSAWRRSLKLRTKQRRRRWRTDEALMTYEWNALPSPALRLSLAGRDAFTCRWAISEPPWLKTSRFTEQQLWDELMKGEVTFFLGEVQLLTKRSTRKPQMKRHHAPPDLCLIPFCIFNRFWYKNCCFCNRISCVIKHSSWVFVDRKLSTNTGSVIPHWTHSLFGE